jgi:hypothetical protein
MITITNHKISGFDPRWATFRGFSLLFDNPTTPTNLPFYQKLDEIP